ncbi:MAG: hypothetical protein ABSC48_06175 [Terracidiphilus sp.]
MDVREQVSLDRRAAVDKSREPGMPYPADERLPRIEDRAEAGSRCAYNRTRGYILGVEIDCGDFSYASLADRLPMLSPKSGAGMWMIPFKGIPATRVPVPLDLIYLDEDCRVIETVEFYPTFRVSPSSPPAASVLALPVHSVFASHTQVDDQVVFGHVEEIEYELVQLFGSNAAASTVQETVTARPEPPRSGTLAPEHIEAHPSQEFAAAQLAEGTAVAEPKSKPKSWLQRLLSPDPAQPRKAHRATLPGLAAYFWTGGAPQAYAISNISSTGLYVVTEERWYPGTLIQMTLKKQGTPGVCPESSISVMVKARRWGNDGVGLAFVIRDSRNSRNGDAAHAGAIDREELNRFLARIGHGKR